MSVDQLNKLQIKAEVMTVISKLQTMPDSSAVDNILEVLLQQEDKKIILDILMKELVKATEQRAVLICFLILKLCDQKEIEDVLWNTLKNPSVKDVTKSLILNLLKDMGNKVDYDKFNEYFENPEAAIDADTKQLLHVAIVNPEAQIDFLDFLSSLSDRDKTILVQSLGEDYSSDALANILIPLFLYEPNSDLGKTALEILGSTKSQLAFHALTEALGFVKDDTTIALIKKNISALKIAGVREDNTIDFYKNILSASKPYKSYTNYPDGHGNQALIFSRERENETIQIVATIINDQWGVVDCFGFNEISHPEFERIVDRFYNGDERIYINHSVLKTLLNKAEELTRKTDGKISYEYICWKTLLSDVVTEPVPVEFILQSKYKNEPLSEDDLEKIYMMDFVQKWFLTTDDNSTLNEIIEELNKKIAKDDFTFDLEKIVQENLSEIFTDEEFNTLCKRILMCGYLKYLAGNNEDAQILYSLYFDDEKKTKLAENIIRKSIYEYYVGFKFRLKEDKKTTNIFALKNKPKVQELSLKQVELIISVIESLWVQNA